MKRTSTGALAAHVGTTLDNRLLPSDLENEAGKVLQVNTGETGFELTDAGGTGTITGVTAGNGLSGGGTSGAVTLNIDVPYTNPEKAKLASLGGDGILVSSGSATAVAIGAIPQNIVADRRPGETPRGSFSGNLSDSDKEPYQFHQAPNLSLIHI